ncbi:MAG: glutathione S-transferase N-terminal domain-containing protein [Candidatus Azosocius agrarius]|nr:MAG: glutathione S-transferase N-terminal domain-containing protein [Gammaproteobacteria bacterium]
MSINLNKRSIMTLYSKSDDVYSHRVRIVLAEKDIIYESINLDIVGYDSLKELIEYNPYLTVPTLIDRDLILFKSEIIMEYLDDRFPHPSLMPVYPVAKGRSRLIIYRINRDWYSLMNYILNNDSKYVDHFRNKLLNNLINACNIFMEMPYFLSDTFSLVDCCIAPILWRLQKLGIKLPKEAFPLIDYAEKIFNRDAFQASLTDAERILRM